MRAKERQAFFIEIQQAQEDEEAFRLEMLEYENMKRLEEQLLKEDQARLRQITFEVLTHFGYEDQVDCFLNSATGLAILANCCNAAAKKYDYNLYEYKPYLITKAAHYGGAEAWQAEGIVYLETSLGQVSFHALYGEDENLPEANGREWNGIEYQMNADLVAEAFLCGWPKDTLVAKIRGREQVRSDFVLVIEQIAC